MTDATLIGSAQACIVLDVDKSTLSRWVKAGKIRPAQQLPGKSGAMLFKPADVARLAVDRGAATR